MSERSNHLLLGAVLGALIGVAVAWVAKDAASERAAGDAMSEARRPRARDWVKFLVAAAALLRQLSDMLSES